MSKGCFDLVPTELNVDFLRLAVDFEINFANMSAVMRKSLRKVIDTGILPSYGGVLAGTYRTIAYYYGWADPHLWTNSGYIGCKLHMTRVVYKKQIGPFLSMMAKDNQRPAYKGRTLLDGPRWRQYVTKAQKDITARKRINKCVV